MADSIDPLKAEEFKILQSEGKYLASIGDLKGSLKKFELAKQICASSKVLQRIRKIKECLNAVDSSGTGQLLPHLSSRSSLPEVNANNSTVLKHTNGSKVELQVCNNIKTESKVLSDIQNIQGNQKLSEKKSESSDLSPQSRLKFKQLKNEAKEFAYAGKYDEAVNSFRRALGIYDCPNVGKYLKEVESLVLANSQQVKEQVKNQSTEKYQPASDCSHGSPDDNSKPIQYSDKKELTKNFKKQSLERNHYSESVEESVEQKSSPFDSKNDFDTERKLAEVKIIYEEARELAAGGNLTDALKLLKEAQAIYETQKVQKRIDKLEELIAAELNDTGENKMIEIAKGFSVYHEIYVKLYPYQREGVAWMWQLFKMRKGGVLGDDMGLGKTFQVIAFISGMIDADLVKHVLIIMPVSLLKNWEKEFKKWCPGIAVHDFHSGTKKERERNLLRAQRRGHVLLTSYGMVLNNVNILAEIEGSEFVWDYVILDEGHKIKNPTKTTKAIYELPAKNRLVLTGTPIQNNLKELWSLYDFVHQGTLLGSLKTFKLQYENPITRSREKDATVGEKRLGLEMAENLKALMKPYFLRRTKSEVWGNNDEDIKDLETQMDNMKITQLNAKKNDLILWTYMSEPQIAIYQDFLHSDAVKSILVSKRSPLVELTTLKKICDHPRLLSQRACFHLGLNGDLKHEDELDLNDESTLASSIDNIPDETLLRESGKLKLVVDLLENLKQTGHRTLVFSLSRKILDMIHRILVNKNWKVMRLDGTIHKTIDREKRIMKFQKDPSYPVFLLTTQVGGVGITLTAADRVIIYDPSWNPATDAQAVDRAYRIGQQKDVIVYRLITCGTVEEKIYRRQIFKDSITRQTTGVADPYRYFSKQELRELFSLDDPCYSATQVQLHEMHAAQRSTYNDLEKHLEFLRGLNIFGISDHDLMFSKQVEDAAEDNDPYAISEHFIKQKVAAAHAQIQMEANVVAEGIRLAGTFNRPYQETVPLIKKSTTKDPYKPPVLPDIVDLTEDAQNNVFPPNVPKRRSFKSSNTFEDDSDDIQIISSKSVNDEIQQISPVKKQLVNVSPELNAFSHTASPSKSLSHYPIIGTYSNSENAVDYVKQSGKLDKSLEDSKIGVAEKLRKSDFLKPSSEDKDNDELMKIKDEDISIMDVVEKLRKSGFIKPFSKDKDDDELLKIKDEDISVMDVAENPAPLDVTCDLKEKFQANLTHFMQDDIDNFSFDEEAPAVSIKKGRKSCARQSTLLISESDTSCPNSASNSNISLKLVDESEEIDSDSNDSSNSASVSFIPDSAANTPQTAICIKGREKFNYSLSKTPPVHLEPELHSGMNTPVSDSSNLKRLEGSVERITPLKVDKILVRQDSFFAQAMANSVIITPEPSPKNEQIHVKTDTFDEEDDDSPMKVFRKRVVRQIHSNSDESDTEDHSDVKKTHNYKEHLKSSDEEEHSHFEKDDDEQQNEVLSNHSSEDSLSGSDESDAEDHSNVKKTQNYQKHLKSLSDDEEQQGEVEVLSNSSHEEHSHFEKDDNEEQQNEVLSNHSSEHSLSGSDSYGERGDDSDLEQTFATCKGKTESDSEDLSSEDSEDYSDESGSLFSEDD